MSLVLTSRRRRQRGRRRPVARPERYCPGLEELESRLAPSAGPNVAVTTDPGVQQMPSIAVDPHDPSHLVVAYMDYSLLTTGYAGIGVQVSHDGGAHLAADLRPPARGLRRGGGRADRSVRRPGPRLRQLYWRPPSWAGDPRITDPAGGRSAARLGFQSNNGIFVARSDDGGLTWDAAGGRRLAPVRRHGPGALRDQAGPGHRHLPHPARAAGPTRTTATCTRSGPATTRRASSPGKPTATAAATSSSPSPATAGRTWQIQLKRRRAVAPRHP